MSDKSGTSVYIGAPEEFAEWIGYPIADLLNRVSELESNSDRMTSPGEEKSVVIVTPVTVQVLFHAFCADKTDFMMG